MDTYTKTVLTVIAACLVIICLQNTSLITPAYANNENLHLPTASYGLVPLNDDGSITVKLADDEVMDVSITDIDTYDELRVKLTDIATTDKLNVNLADINTNDNLNVNIDKLGSYSTFGKLKVQVVE